MGYLIILGSVVVGAVIGAFTGRNSEYRLIPIFICGFFAGLIGFVFAIEFTL